VELPGFLPDILVLEGDNLYLRDRPFDLAGKEKAGRYGHHLYSSAGLLDPHWWHRTIWIWGTRAWGRASGWAIAGKYNPSGRLLVLGRDRVYGYKFAESGKHELFCADKKVVKSDKKLSNNNAAIVKYVTPDKVVTHWNEKIDFAVRGMVKAGDVLFVAGPDHAEEIHFDAKSASTLAAYGADTGKALSRMKLSCQPVFDGMAAADKRLFLSLTNGKVVCYGAK
jgi:hypothetical protein